MGESAAKLQSFFRSSEAATKATRPLKRDAEVGITFTDEPDTPYRFTMESGRGEVVPGTAKDEDFHLHLPPVAVDELVRLETDNLGEFAVAFFKCMLADEEERKIRVKLHSGFLKLTRRGYLKTLALGGPTVLAFMARQGLKGPAGIKKAIDKLRKG
ncbi:MAG: AAA family ATPase [Deltaproteobacteria bacterium]|nr:MAG: AAA family ATPase [Deltaproteobacteria bacterium]